MDPKVEIGPAPWDDGRAPPRLFQRRPRSRIDRGPVPADDEHIDVAVGIVPALRERTEDEHKRDPEGSERGLQCRDDTMGPRVELAERQEQWMLRIDAPQPQVRDPTAAHDALSFESLQGALDRMDGSTDPPDELAGMQLRTRSRREQREQARGGLAT